MDRGIPVGNKICARREAQRRHDLHCVRIKNMRSLTDTSEPTVLQMDHVRNNLKKEQMLEERYSEIDRENRILLKKMSDIMKQPTPRQMEAPPGPQSLNRDFRKKELLRITKENQSILKRIQQAQPIYNHVEWDGHHSRQQRYLQNCAEYPLVLKQRRKPGTPSSQLVPLEEAKPENLGNFSARSHMEPIEAPPEDDVKYVLKEGHRIGGTYYLLEMSTRGQTLNISAYDGENNVTLDLVVKDRVHRRLFRESNGDYSLLAQRLRVVDGNKLILADASEAQAEPLTARQPEPSTARGLPSRDVETSSDLKVSEAAPAPTVPPVLPKKPASRGGNRGEAAAGNEELDADAMVAPSAKSAPTSAPREVGTPGGQDGEPVEVLNATTGSAGSSRSVQPEAEVVLNSAGEPMVRLRGMTPSSGERHSPGFGL